MKEFNLLLRLSRKCVGAWLHPLEEEEENLFYNGSILHNICPEIRYVQGSILHNTCSEIRYKDPSFIISVQRSGTRIHPS